MSSNDRCCWANSCGLIGNIYLPSDALSVENAYTKPGMRSNMADT